VPASSDTQPSVTSERKSKKKARLGIAERPAPNSSSWGAAVPAAVESPVGKLGDKKLRKGARGTEVFEVFE
jgi:hypothetical protein